MLWLCMKSQLLWTLESSEGKCSVISKGKRRQVRLAKKAVKAEKKQLRQQPDDELPENQPYVVAWI